MGAAQTCLAVLMAQIGAWVPARSFELSPVDAIFVRMGARDSVMSGQVRHRFDPITRMLPQGVAVWNYK